MCTKQLLQYYWIERSMVFVRRFRHSRGFGIQSPSAYRFVRYVINEHYPYYAYADLQKQYAHASRLSLKMGRLYFRIANYAQARTWGICTRYCNMYVDYIKAGCRKTHVEDCIHGDEKELVVASDVLLMAIEGNWHTVFNTFAAAATARSVLIVEDIGATQDARRAWQTIVSDERTGVAFDLYYCGIVFFDHTKAKQHHIINF